jgi:predicted RNase H-like nuclease (RuvC/YqgF family)
MKNMLRVSAVSVLTMPIVGACNLSEATAAEQNYNGSTIEREAPELERNIPELKRDIPELKRDIPELKRNIPELKPDIPEFKRDLPGLEHE